MKTILLFLAFLGLSAQAQTVALSINRNTGVVVNTNTALHFSATVNLRTNVTVGGNVTVTNQILADGTFALPSYSFLGNTDMGMFRSAANQIGFSVGGDLQARILSSGRLTLDDNSAELQLGVNGDVALQRQSAGVARIAGSLTITNGSTITNGLTLLSLGSGGTPAILDQVWTSTVNINFASVGVGEVFGSNVTVTGVGTNDYVHLTKEPGLASLHGINWDIAITATNTVTIYAANYNALTGVNPPAGDFRIKVMRIR